MENFNTEKNKDDERFHFNNPNKNSNAYKEIKYI